MVPRRGPSRSWPIVALPLPPRRVSVRGAREGERSAVPARARSTSCSTRASSTTTGTGSSRSTTRRPDRTTSRCSSPSGTSGPDAATLHVLPTLWFRKTWSWDASAPAAQPVRPTATAIRASHPDVGEYVWSRTRRRMAADRSCCSARTRRTRHASSAPRPSRRVPRTASTTTWSTGRRRSTRHGRGRKAAAWYRLTVAAGATAEVRLRLRRDRRPSRRARPDGDLSGRRSTPRCALARRGRRVLRRPERPDATDEEAMVMRQAFAGMLWSKQYYAL